MRWRGPSPISPHGWYGANPFNTRAGGPVPRVRRYGRRAFGGTACGCSWCVKFVLEDGIQNRIDWIEQNDF